MPHPPMRPSPEQFATAFWSFVDKAEGPGACWPWMRSRYRNGYGQTSYNRKKLLTHRVAYELANGPIFHGLRVLHRCDNPPCCNPAHLFAGTQLENIADMDMKGRGRRGVHRGETHPRCKFPDAVVAAARAMYAEGSFSQREVARKFGISKGYITQLLHSDFR
jgi:hypothetical protein